MIDFIKDGLVQSKAFIKDKRSNILSLTPKGRSYMEKHFEHSDRYFNELLESMNENDRKEFIKVLKTIDKILSK